MPCLSTVFAEEVASGGPRSPNNGMMWKDDDKREALICRKKNYIGPLRKMPAPPDLLSGHHGLPIDRQVALIL